MLELESPTHLTLFPDYKGTPINECLLAASENHICVACSYGATLKTDTERYHIYNKDAFLAMLIKGDCTQASLNSCRVATGMFTGSNSIGMNIPKNKAVIQSLGLGDDTDTNRVIIFGAVDDRTIGDNYDGRMIHQINRACLDLKESGSAAALKAQDPASVRCYYSPVDKLVYIDKKTGKKTVINMNYVSPEPNPSIPTNPVKMRFELEGIKYIRNSGTTDIPNGWYISVYNSYLSALQHLGEAEGKEAILWNHQIYQPTGRPTTAWKPST